MPFANRPVRSTFPLAALALVIITGCQTPGLEPGPVEASETLEVTGRLVISGGGLNADNEAVYRAIAEGRDGDGPLCVIPTAGGDPQRSMDLAVGRIDRWSGEGTAQGILLSVHEPERAHLPRVADSLRACSGYFFTGGIQSRIREVFLPNGEPTLAYDAIMERFLEGAVVSGSSAGAAMMSDPMIVAGSSAGAFRSGIRVGTGSGGVLIQQGLGFRASPVVDQHFLARGRIGRLLVTLLGLDGVDVGVGIDENTALVVDGDRARVTGASGVVFVDSSGAHGNGDGPTASGIRIELLGARDVIDLRTGRITTARDKAPLPANGEGHLELPEGDLFERWYLLHFLEEFARTDVPEAQVSVDEGYRFVFRKGSSFRALAYESPGVRGTPHGLSVGPVEVEIQPEPARATRP